MVNSELVNIGGPFRNFSLIKAKLLAPDWPSAKFHSDS